MYKIMYNSVIVFAYEKKCGIENRLSKSRVMLFAMVYINNMH